MADDAEFVQRERRLVRKLDLCIAPIVMITQLVSYLDRGNIGFAATQGMIQDIHLHGSDLNVAVSIFYVFYILAEFPAAIYVERLGFRRVLPVIMFAWGIICMCNGFVQSYAGLLVCRLLLGLMEGFLFPTLALIQANWYKREELSQRIAYLFIAAALSGAFGGLIAFAILYMDGVAGYAGWRWLYIIEGGVITPIWTICVIFLLPSSYEKAWFLTSEEKEIQKQRLLQMQIYNGEIHSHKHHHYTLADIRWAIADAKVWIHGCIQIAVVTVQYGFSTFLPLILKEGFNYTTKQAQYLVIPVNLWGAMFYAVLSYFADKYQKRFVTMILLAPAGIVGYALLLSKSIQHLVAVEYFATYLIASATYLTAGTNCSWLALNSAPDGKRAASLGVLLTLTNIGGIISGQIYQTSLAPRYILGHAWSLSCFPFAFAGWWILFYIYRRRNAGKCELQNRQQTAEQSAKDRTAMVVLEEPTTDRGAEFRYQF